MELKVGDVIEFKKYENMTEFETVFIIKESFPRYGKIKGIQDSGYFYIEDCGYVFNSESVAKIIKSADVDDCFIVQENFYGLYIGGSGDLVSDKDRAKIYESRDKASDEAWAMCLSSWDVIPYDD